MKSGGHPIHREHGVSEIVTAADDPRGAADSAGAVGAGIPLAGARCRHYPTVGRGTTVGANREAARIGMLSRSRRSRWPANCQSSNWQTYRVEIGERHVVNRIAFA